MNPLSKDIQDATDVLIREFRPLRVILFGSRAYGHPRPDSDTDLLVILPFECSTHRMTVNMLGAIGGDKNVDLVPRRPQDVKMWYDAGDPMMRDALDRGIVLYEAAA